MRAKLEGDSGRIHEEAAPWDLAAFETDELTGESLAQWKRYTRRLLEQRTLAVVELHALRMVCMIMPAMRRQAAAGDREAAREIRETLLEFGILEPWRIEPFTGPRPTLADVLPFQRNRASAESEK